MPNTRIWVIAGALVVFVVIALGGLLGVKPQLDAAQASTSDRETVEALNVQHAAELVALKEDFTRLEEVTAQVAALRSAVPAHADLDTFNGELAALATQAGVVVTSYAPQDLAMFAPSAEIAPLVPPTINSTNFATISVSIAVAGTREGALAFVSGLQSGPRLVLVHGLNVSAVEEGVTTVTISGLLYVLLDTPYVDPAAVVETPAPEAAASE